MLQKITSAMGFGRGAAQTDLKTRSGFNVSEFKDMMRGRITPWNRGRLSFNQEGIPQFPMEPTLFSVEMAEAVKGIAEDMEEQKAATIETYKNLVKINGVVTTVESAHAKGVASVSSQNADMLENLVAAHSSVNKDAVNMAGSMAKMGRSVRETDRALLLQQKYDRGLMKARTWGV